MILLITGASHTGKTALAQMLLEKFHYPYLSIDHLKMGLIRSHQTNLTPLDDEKLTEYLWPIVREMIRTACENRQNLIVEGCYIPQNWTQDFCKEELRNIRCLCLIMTSRYLTSHFDSIRNYADTIEKRLDDSDLSLMDLEADNALYGLWPEDTHTRLLVIDDEYAVDAESLPTDFAM